MSDAVVVIVCVVTAAGPSARAVDAATRRLVVNAAGRMFRRMGGIARAEIMAERLGARILPA